MADKIFGTDFTDTTNPIGTETVSINDGTVLKDVTLRNLVYQIIANAPEEFSVHDDDNLGLLDSQNSNAARRVEFSTIWSWIQSKAGIAGGWIEVSDSWSYASASTITVPSDATTKYQKGDKIRFKQGAGYKYFYVTTVAATLLTVNAGSDYSVANSAITDIAYSRAENPFGFPSSFNYVPTFSAGVTIGNGTLSGKIKLISGNIVKLKGRLVFGNSTSVTGNVNTDTPAGFSIQAIYETSANIGLCTLVDTGTAVYYGVSLVASATALNLRPLNVSATYLNTSLLSSTVPFTWTTSDELGWDVTYFLA